MTSVYSDYSQATDILSLISDGSNSDEDEVRFGFSWGRITYRVGDHLSRMDQFGIVLDGDSDVGDIVM